ncbi:MAG: hypothetical protein MUP41_00090 [Desulfobacterales bacterium]|nr:hypothetical protein [Desulfobacterales bacterium]
MVQYLENALKYDRVSRWKSWLERLRMFFDAEPGVHSKEKADRVDCNEDTKTWQADMKERLGGSWW